MVLVGGLGGLGVGVMWFPESPHHAAWPMYERITDPGVIGFRRRSDLTYDTAPEMHCPTPEEIEAARERERVALSYR
jgi:hypothetical protein